MTRKRPRKPRVRREPIDLEQLAAEFADLPEPEEIRPEEIRPEEIRPDEQEILVALEAEVERVKATRTAETPSPPAPAPVDPFGIIAPFGVGDADPVVEPGPSRVGLPLDQVRAWLEQVQGDLRRIQARLRSLEAEQTRLQEQHHIVAELLTSSTPV